MVSLGPNGLRYVWDKLTMYLGMEFIDCVSVSEWRISILDILHLQESHFCEKIWLNHAPKCWNMLHCKLHLYETLKFDSLWRLYLWPSFDLEKEKMFSYTGDHRGVSTLEIRHSNPRMEIRLYDHRKWYILSHYVFLSDSCSQCKTMEIRHSALYPCQRKLWIIVAHLHWRYDTMIPRWRYAYHYIWSQEM